MAKGLSRAVCLLTLLAGLTAPALAQTSARNKTNAYVQVTLRQQLRAGLKCRRPVEFEFVDRVTRLVDEGKLPIDLVNICFAWSRHQNSFRPFVYFERSLTQLARDKGCPIDIKPKPASKLKLLGSIAPTPVETT